MSWGRFGDVPLRSSLDFDVACKGRLQTILRALRERDGAELYLRPRHAGVETGKDRESRRGSKGAYTMTALQTTPTERPGAEITVAGQRYRVLEERNIAGNYDPAKAKVAYVMEIVEIADGPHQ